MILVLAPNRKRARNCKKFAGPLHTWPLKSLNKQKKINSWKTSKDNKKQEIKDKSNRDNLRTILSDGNKS